MNLHTACQIPYFKFIINYSIFCGCLPASRITLICIKCNNASCEVKNVESKLCLKISLLKALDINKHCVKSVRIWSFSGTNAGNTDHKNSEHEHFLRCQNVITVLPLLLTWCYFKSHFSFRFPLSRQGYLRNFLL